MKKYFTLALLFIISFTSMYAFDIVDSNDNQRSFFSLSESELTVIGDSNTTPLVIEYNFNSNQESREYNFTQCNTRYCIDVDLLDLFTTTNQSTSIPNEFIFKVGPEQKTISLDVEKPTITINNQTINAQNNTLEFDISYQDNSNSIKEIILYVKEGSSYIFKKTITENSNTYNLNNQEEIDYKITVEDQAGNIGEIESNIEVGDIFEPEIISLVYTLKDNTFEVEMEVKDQELESYSFTQGTVSLQEEISGTSYKKTLTLPFTKGEVILEIIDANGNSKTQLLTLKDGISISSLSKYSNEEEYTFTSNADVCYLIEVDGRDDDSKFSKSSSRFTVDINVPKFEEVEVNFYCEKNGFRKYFEEEFFYDTASPEEIELTAVANDDGEIELNWTESKDEDLDVTYIVYRDSDEIYEGSRTKFTDDEVEYPDSYEYYVEVRDLADNKEESDEIEISPLKTEIDFSVTTTNNQITQNNLFSLKGNLENKATLNIEVTNNNNLIDTKSISSSGGSFSVQIVLQEGVNTIISEATDSLGNTIKKYTYVTYEPLPPVVQKSTQVIESNLNTVEEPVKEEPKAVIQKEESVETIIEETPEVEKTSWYWLWIVLFIIILLFFIYIIFSRENVIREKLQRKSKEVQHKYSKSRKTDLILGKNLERTRQERIRKQQEEKDKKRRLEELKNKKEESEYQKQKLNELSRKKEVHFSEFDRKKAERRVNKIKRETTYEDELEKIKEHKEKPSLFKKLFSKEEKEVKQDAMSDYIGKQKENKSWNDTYSYRSSHIEKLKAEEDAKIKAIEEEKKLKELKIKEEQTKQQIQADKNRKEQEHLERKTSANEFINKSKEKRVDLDEYLGKRTKKKSFFFAEKAVERDLNNRK